MCDSDSLSSDDFFIREPVSKSESLTLNTFVLDDVEREVIRRALIRHGNNVSKTAEESGIGLSLACQIMRLHNGKVKLLSSVKGNTTFALKF